MFHSGPFDPDFFQNYIPLGLMGVAKINKRLPIGYKCTLVRPKVMVSVTKMDGITKQAFWRHYGLKFFQKKHQNCAVAFFLVLIFFSWLWNSSKVFQLLTWTRRKPFVLTNKKSLTIDRKLSYLEYQKDWIINEHSWISSLITKPGKLSQVRLTRRLIGLQS